MKYSELDFKGANFFFNQYENYSEEEYFTYGFLDQDLMCLLYDDINIDVGWYGDRYSIFVLEPIDADDENGSWSPLFKIEVFEHEKLFDTLQQIINDRKKYLKLKMFL